MCISKDRKTKVKNLCRWTNVGTSRAVLIYGRFDIRIWVLWTKGACLQVNKKMATKDEDCEVFGVECGTTYCSRDMDTGESRCSMVGGF